MSDEEEPRESGSWKPAEEDISRRGSDRNDLTAAEGKEKEACEVTV